MADFAKFVLDLLKFGDTDLVNGLFVVVVGIPDVLADGNFEDFSSEETEEILVGFVSDPFRN